MRFKRRMSSEEGLKQMEITPLIDCVFQLLIFFMLTSNFVIAPGINIKLPSASKSEQVETNTVTIVVSSEDIIYVKDKVYTLEELEDFLGRKSFKSIFIKADREASLGGVVSIWNICRKLGIEKISIATIKED
ncbi:MAG: biopolymer transporter ExbD [Candidatus Omnitrophica bacterium]|nr:biopolymer transporter ExbD [Candidatus Omnitrophota bacterium]